MSDLNRCDKTKIKMTEEYLSKINDDWIILNLKIKRLNISHKDISKYF